METTKARTWSEVNLPNIEENYKMLRARMGNETRFLGIVKADAYGHGAVQVAALLSRLGCEYIGVATIDEAVSLRENGIALPILILGYTQPGFADTLLEHNLTQTVFDFDTAEALSARASKSGAKIRTHIKIDSGMGRLGFRAKTEAEIKTILQILDLPGLDCEGVFTHFAVSEDDTDDFTQNQLNFFKSIVMRLEADSGKVFKIKHCANSGAVINCTEAYFDMVRPGIALYGHNPGCPDCDIPLKSAMSLKTRIIQIKELEAGDTVSYGRIFTAQKKTKIAVLPIGYADGLFRALSGKTDMLLHGRRVKQIGRICMDLSVIDITGIDDTKIGDIVTVFGEDSGETISAEELAEICGTLSYEILCGVSKRVPRVYIGGAD